MPTSIGAVVELQIFLPFMGLEPLRRTNEQSKLASRLISYLIKLIKTVLNSTIEDIARNLKSVTLKPLGFTLSVNIIVNKLMDITIYLVFQFTPRCIIYTILRYFKIFMEIVNSMKRCRP